MSKKVTGIGGIFFKCKDPDEMRNWYRDHLGLVTNEYGSLIEIRKSDEPETLVEELRKAGITILDEIEEFEYGIFVHILDPEQNKIELWEPVDQVFTDEYGNEVTK
mgnify:CR=1 FL=1